MLRTKKGFIQRGFWHGQGSSGASGLSGKSLHKQEKKTRRLHEQKALFWKKRQDWSSPNCFWLSGLTFTGQMLQLCWSQTLLTLKLQLYYWSWETWGSSHFSMVRPILPIYFPDWDYEESLHTRGWLRKGCPACSWRPTCWGWQKGSPLTICIFF